MYADRVDRKLTKAMDGGPKLEEARPGDLVEMHKKKTILEEMNKTAVGLNEGAGVLLAVKEVLEEDAKESIPVLNPKLTKAMTKLLGKHEHALRTLDFSVDMARTPEMLDSARHGCLSATPWRNRHTRIISLRALCSPWSLARTDFVTKLL
jgi:hypothetical protein